MWNLLFIFGWLNLANPGFLNDAHQAILDRIRQEQQGGNLAAAIQLINRLIELCKLREVPEAQATCALICSEMNDIEYAAELLDQARKGFINDEHRLAVASWMQGIVLWDRMEMRQEVIENWMRAIGIFQRIAVSRNHPAKGIDPAWHAGQLPLMEAALQDAVDTEIIL